jgi:hypothetical protein
MISIRITLNCSVKHEVFKNIFDGNLVQQLTNQKYNSQMVTSFVSLSTKTVRLWLTDNIVNKGNKI